VSRLAVVNPHHLVVHPRVVIHPPLVIPRRHVVIPRHHVAIPHVTAVENPRVIVAVIRRRVHRSQYLVVQVMALINKNILL
jgi:hypothetical protein